MENDYGKLSIEMHKKFRGKLEIKSKIPVKDLRDLSIAYSPGVASPCIEIQKDESLMPDFVINGETVAVITDGSAVLGLGDIGPKAALPVMEGKAVLFKEFAGLNSFPIALNTQDVETIIQTIKTIAPSFGGINLEDISAPRCFEIEERLKKELDIPVFHDDQHGTAIVLLAGLINSLKITGKNIEEVKIVINGAGASAIASAKLLNLYGFKNIVICDSKGIISENRNDLNSYKKDILRFVNPEKKDGLLENALENADIFIGLSRAGTLKPEMISKMKKDPIIFALANPIPEIMPEDAKIAGARIIGTGRSDYPNQINNVLVFPGIFKGAIRARAKDITNEMKIEAAKALANLVKNPSEDKIIPNPFEPEIAESVAKAVENLARKNKS